MKATIVLALFTFLVGISQIGNVALAGNPCTWRGKAPACNGKCNAGETLVKMGKSGDGKKCVTGKKAYCCLTHQCTWRGTAPACNGKCKSGETNFGTDKKGDGKKCVTGNKVLCCKD